MTQIAIRSEQETPATPPLTVDEIVRYICPKATAAEAFMFLRLCQSQGLNPFERDAYLIKYDASSPATMVVGKETFTKRANAHPNFEGFRAGIIIVRREEVMELEGTFYLESDILAGGWAEIVRSDRKVPLKVTVRLSEYNTNKAQWAKMPATMIRKVALVQALRESFPDRFAGLYDSSEMGVDPDTLPDDRVVVEGHVEAPALASAPVPNHRQEPRINDPDGPATEAQRRKIFAAAHEHGWSDGDLKTHIATTYDLTSSKDLTKGMAAELIGYIEDGSYPAVPPVPAEQAGLL